jgi:hypothetical protein
MKQKYKEGSENASYHGRGLRCINDPLSRAFFDAFIGAVFFPNQSPGKTAWLMAVFHGKHRSLTNPNQIRECCSDEWTHMIK